MADIKLKIIYKGNVVRFGSSYWIVCEERKNDKLGRWYPLLSMNASNCSSGVYEFPSNPEWHINQVEVVAANVFEFIEMGMLGFLDDLGKHKGK